MTHLPNGPPIAAIPEALRQRSQWVLWRLDPKDDKPEELTKVPYRDVGRKAKANDSKTWIPFDEAVQRWAANPNGWAGIGYEFGEFGADGCSYTGIDFDNCLEPATGIVAEWADEELTLLLPTYAEISPSGKGIKLWVETEQAHKLGSSDKDPGQVEVYSSGRFFAVTGRAFEDAPPTIAKADDTLIEQIIAREKERRQARRPKTAPNGTRPPSTNGTHPPLTIPALASVLERLHPDRWAAYDDWLRIGMALHYWASGDDQRMATARALFDQYSKERAPDVYGQVDEKWASFGKRNSEQPDVTIGTLIRWVNEDDPPEDPPHPAETIDDALADDPPMPPLAPLSSFRELPQAARLSEALGADACPWLDACIDHIRYRSPRSYDDFYEACALWILSTVAARRVTLPLGRARYTNLMAVLCARSTIWAKSSAVWIAKEILHTAGLDALLAADDATPQKFLDDLAEQPFPSNWADLSDAAQKAVKTRIAFAGQRGWFFEEFGQKMRSMMREGSVMAEYHGHFRRFDDCLLSYTYGTIARGNRMVDRPYLALLASMTPADLAPFARKGSALWTDGFFARYAFITPPADADRKRDRFPEESRAIPSALTQQLRDWHEQLGVPEVTVTEQRDDKSKVSKYTYTVKLVDPQPCTLGDGVYDAYYRYDEALIDLAAASGNTDLDGSYGRFAEKALRVAMLLASFSNGGRIELSHWARAQAIAERWRRGLHHLIDQLGQSDATPERVHELKVIDELGKRGALSARDVARFANISTGEAHQILDQLTKAGETTVEPGKRTKRYRLTATSVVTVVPSQLSQPAQSYDTSTGQAGRVEEVSYKNNDYDTNDYTTVTTLPAGDGDGGSEPGELMEEVDLPDLLPNVPLARMSPYDPEGMIARLKAGVTEEEPNDG
jgi:hypothetical protein